MKILPDQKIFWDVCKTWIASGETPIADESEFDAAYKKAKKSNCKNPSQQRLSWASGKKIPRENTIWFVAVGVFELESVEIFWGGPSGKRMEAEKIRRVIGQIEMGDQILKVGPLFWPFLTEIVKRPMKGYSTESMFGPASRLLHSKRLDLTLAECVAICLGLKCSPHALPWPNDVSETAALAMAKTGYCGNLVESKLDMWLTGHSLHYGLTEFEARKSYELAACERLADSPIATDEQLVEKRRAKRKSIAKFVQAQNELLREAIVSGNLQGMVETHTVLHEFLCEGFHVNRVFRDIFLKTSPMLSEKPYLRKLWLEQHDRLVQLLEQDILSQGQLRDWFAKEWILCAVGFVIRTAAA